MTRTSRTSRRPAIANDNDVARQRGAEAQYVLDHPMLVAAFAACREKWLLGWQRSSPHETDLRETLYYLNTALDEVESELTKHVKAGNLAASAERQTTYARERGEGHHDSADLHPTG